MLASYFLAAFLPILAIAKYQAGGPGFVAIPPSCTVISSLPHANGGLANVDHYVPSPAFNTTNLIYETYFDGFYNNSYQVELCGEQCMGLTGCLSVFVAYNAPTPVGYAGTPGGALDTTCLFYKDYLTPMDFVLNDNAIEYKNETAWSIYC